jgi:hypothetical protein
MIGAGEFDGAAGFLVGLNTPDFSKIVRKLQTTRTNMAELIPKNITRPATIFALTWRKYMPITEGETIVCRE